MEIGLLLALSLIGNVVLSIALVSLAKSRDKLKAILSKIHKDTEPEKPRSKPSPVKMPERDGNGRRYF